MKLIDYFDKYVELGLKPIAIYPNQKCPMSNEWNINWSVKRWRPYFYTNDCNIGILLGDIVDVEGGNAISMLGRVIEQFADGEVAWAAHLLLQVGLGGDDRRENDGVVHRADHCSAGLARDLARLERDLVGAE